MVTISFARNEGLVYVNVKVGNTSHYLRIEETLHSIRLQLMEGAEISFISSLGNGFKFEKPPHDITIPNEASLEECLKNQEFIGFIKEKYEKEHRPQLQKDEQISAIGSFLSDRFKGQILNNLGVSSNDILKYIMLLEKLKKPLPRNTSQESDPLQKERFIEIQTALIGIFNGRTHHQYRPQANYSARLPSEDTARRETNNTVSQLPSPQTKANPSSHSKTSQSSSPSFRKIAEATTAPDRVSGRSEEEGSEELIKQAIKTNNVTDDFIKEKTSWFGKIMEWLDSAFTIASEFFFKDRGMAVLRLPIVYPMKSS